MTACGCETLPDDGRTWRSNDIALFRDEVVAWLRAEGLDPDRTLAVRRTRFTVEAEVVKLDADGKPYACSGADHPATRVTKHRLRTRPPAPMRKVPA